MRHTFYANNRNLNGGRGSGKPFNRIGYSARYEPSTKRSAVKDKSDMILNSKIKSLLEMYSDNPGIRYEILSHVVMYQINVSIAREYHDEKTIADLKRKLIKYLNKKSKEKR